MSGSASRSVVLINALKPLVLASGSPRRRRILAELGLEFEVAPAEIEELAPAGVSPGQAAESMARDKARAVASGRRAGTVIGADTIVVDDEDRLIGKPTDAADARAILGRLSATTHRVITGVALIHLPSGVELVEHETTRVTMREMSGQEITEYVASGESFGKAGAYAIQEKGDRFVSALDGDYDNVVGFPAARFRSMLERLAERLAEGNEDRSAGEESGP